MTETIKIVFKDDSEEVFEQGTLTFDAYVELFCALSDANQHNSESEGMREVLKAVDKYEIKSLHFGQPPEYAFEYHFEKKTIDIDKNFGATYYEIKQRTPERKRPSVDKIKEVISKLIRDSDQDVDVDVDVKVMSSEDLPKEIKEKLENFLDNICENPECEVHNKESSKKANKKSITH